MNWINAFEILCYAITALLLCNMIRKKDWVQLIFWAAMYDYCLASLWSLGILQTVPWYGLFAVILSGPCCSALSKRRKKNMPGTMNLTLSEIIPVWADLNQQTQNALLASAQERRVDKGTIVHNGTTECTGLIMVEDGQLRAYALSPDGREITLYRLLERDVCLFSASCMLRGIQFDITVEAEQATRFWIVPAEVYQRAMTQSIELSNYTNQLMAERLSDVMWLLEKVLWQSFDRRLAEFLLEESNLAGSDELSITHEIIARHLGTAREVVTRMLKYFKSEGLITLTRGTIRILDKERLEALSEG